MTVMDGMAQLRIQIEAMFKLQGKILADNTLLQERIEDLNADEMNEQCVQVYDVFDQMSTAFEGMTTRIEQLEGEMGYYES